VFLNLLEDCAVTTVSSMGIVVLLLQEELDRSSSIRTCSFISSEYLIRVINVLDE
jgi:hypothetical protein